MDEVYFDSEAESVQPTKGNLDADGWPDAENDSKDDVEDMVTGSKPYRTDGHDPSLVDAGEKVILKAFEVKIRMMKKAAASLREDETNPPMTWSTACFLWTHDVDHLVGLYMPGFSRKARALFAKPWTTENLLDLPLAQSDLKTGVYLLMAVLKRVAVGAYEL
ncbi:hypothetical protein PMG11_00448 [Penicillium brasilianum]|uniref:Uncharacterized protein n=1 Tax=Penicillium brasilianum TaxID=104259 RepID=A0A0F7TF57_PENBI|nr:hypothetical protein PMG11_00448 [Penicillium brasilianum]